MRRFPVNPGAIWALVREVKAATEDFRPLLIAGAKGPAESLREDVVAGGEAEAARDVAGRPVTAYDLEGAGLLVYVVEGEETSRDDEEILRLADRKDVETICLLVGAARSDPVDVPYVLATDVIRVRPGEEIPLEEVVERIAERAGDKSYALAARLPVLRKPVCEAVIRGIARQNGILAAAIFLPGADLPALTLNQVRMVFRIAAAYGEEIDRERAPELLGVLGAGLGFRAVAREALALVPGPGWALKGAIAYAGTRALGEAAVAYFERGGAKRLAGAVGSVRSRS